MLIKIEGKGNGIQSSRSKEKIYRSSLWWLIPGVQYSGVGGRRILSLMPAWATEKGRSIMLVICSTKLHEGLLLNVP